MKQFLFSIIAVFSFFSCLYGDDFDVALGQDTPRWKQIATREDKEVKDFFKEVYNRNRVPFSLNHIPRVIHWIWLGPDKFPEKSKKRIQTWIKLHPGWKFKFWTDLDREVPCTGMDKKLISDFPLGENKHHYDRSDNFWEKSLVLRYAILFKEGGVVLDHDIEPAKAIETFVSGYDFVASLECLQPTVLSTSVFPSPSFIASKTAHPALEYTLTWLQKHWDRIGVEYPGTDLACLTNRVMHRSVNALGYGVRRGLDLPGNRDIVFPVIPFGKHLGEHSWAKADLAWGLTIGPEIVKLEKRTMRAQYFAVATLLLNVFALSFFLRRKT